MPLYLPLNRNNHIVLFPQLLMMTTKEQARELAMNFLASNNYSPDLVCELDYVYLEKDESLPLIITQPGSEVCWVVSFEMSDETDYFTYISKETGEVFDFMNEHRFVFAEDLD